MDNVQRAKIKDIKARIRIMLQEHSALEAGAKVFASPSELWSGGCSRIDYMLWLPEDYFAKLRMHTYHFTSDNYQTYMFSDPEWFKVTHGLDALTKDIPP